MEQNDRAQSAEEIVRGLLATAEIIRERGDETVSKWLVGWMEIAAAKITELNDFASSQCAKLLERVMDLEAQLTASQQETRAAVEAIRVVASGKCCQICSRDCIGHDDITACTAFVWRGPQEAGEGAE